jgi:hypothetical protein
MADCKMDFDVVFLDEGASDSLEVFFGPVDFKVTGDCIHETLVSFENFGRTGGEQGLALKN